MTNWSLERKSWSEEKTLPSFPNLFEVWNVTCSIHPLSWMSLEKWHLRKGRSAGSQPQQGVKWVNRMLEALGRHAHYVRAPLKGAWKCSFASAQFLLDVLLSSHLCTQPDPSTKRKPVKDSCAVRPTLDLVWTADEWNRPQMFIQEYFCLTLSLGKSHCRTTGLTLWDKKDSWGNK